MIALYIILGILLLLFLITLIRVELLFYYSETPILTLKILFVKIKLFPREKKEKKPKKEKKKKKKKKPEKEPEAEEGKEKKKKKSYLGKLLDKKGLNGLISLFTDLAKIATGAMKDIFSHLVFKKLDVGIMLSGEDAASVAVNYGRVCSAFYPAINVISAVSVCKDYHVSVEPVFDPDQPTQVYADIHAYLRIIFVLAAALKAGVRVLIARIKM